MSYIFIFINKIQILQITGYIVLDLTKNPILSEKTSCGKKEINKMNIGNLPPLLDKEVVVALGIEGSANKIGVGIIRYTRESDVYEVGRHENMFFEIM